MKPTPFEILMCNEFARKILGNIDGNDFMDVRSKRRTPEKIKEDNIRGKLAEVFICNAIGRKGISSILNFDIYEEGIGDSFDVISNGKSIDVKASSPFAKCLMVEESKMKSWKSSDPPDYLCMVSIGLDLDIRYMFGLPYERFAVQSAFMERGCFIPNTRVPLKTSNHVVTRDKCDIGHMHLVRFLTGENEHADVQKT